MALVLWIVLTIACWIIYHKLFHVIYFNTCSALLGEALGCAALAMLLVGFLI